VVNSGILDAPQLKGGKAGRGTILTKIIDGACKSVDAEGTPFSEFDRLSILGIITDKSEPAPDRNVDVLAKR
jgi:hypothetical protein